MRTRGPLMLALLLFAAPYLKGCTTWRPMTVVVRDRATGKPVASALIEVRPLYLFVPLKNGPSIVLNPFTEGSRTAWSDESGRVLIDAPIDRPFDVYVISPGPVIHGLTIERHPESLRDGVTDWLRLVAAQEDLEPVTRFEIQLGTIESEDDRGTGG
jgi:hypothetical protein